MIVLPAVRARCLYQESHKVLVEHIEYERPIDDDGALVNVGLKELLQMHTHPVDYTYPELELQQYKSLKNARFRVPGMRSDFMITPAKLYHDGYGRGSGATTFGLTGGTSDLSDGGTGKARSRRTSKTNPKTKTLPRRSVKGKPATIPSELVSSFTLHDYDAPYEDGRGTAATATAAAAAAAAPIFPASTSPSPSPFLAPSAPTSPSPLPPVSFTGSRPGSTGYPQQQQQPPQPPPALSSKAASPTKQRQAPARDAPKPRKRKESAPSDKPNAIAMLAAELGVDVKTLKSTKDDDALSLSSELSELEDD